MTDINSLVGIGPKTATAFRQIGIDLVENLLDYYPYRYLDFSHTLKIADYDQISPATYSGIVLNFQNVYTRSHKNIQKATIKDSTGTLDLIWFNSPYLAKIIKVDEIVNVAGIVSLYKHRPTIIAPMLGQKTGRIIPLYHQAPGLRSSQIEKIFHQNHSQIFKNITDPLPLSIITKYRLGNLLDTLTEIHFPTSQKNISTAQLRLSLDQALQLLATSNIQKNILNQKRVAKKMSKVTPINFLPYELSQSQKLSWQEIQNDLLLSVPCHRLISGDVGSGKTIIALLAAHMASINHQISLIIAPTQVLAKQHFEFFSNILPHTPIIFLDKKTKKIPRNAIIISTHTAFYKDTKFIKQISLLIIDEQHKFGVNQRNFLSSLPHPPHTISLTATPIPRTLALSIYGHLDISYLDHLDRWHPVKTFVVPPPKQNSCYQWLDQHIQKTHQQAFIVCPFIEDSDTLTTVKSVTSEFGNLKLLLPHLKLGLIHSQIKLAQRQKIFNDFASNKINILVTTPIIEVGIDYPNAGVIIIQSADRFGLASLHQLRGRVGRGVELGYCYLFSPRDNSRLTYLASHYEGRQLAEFDLQTRGQGKLFSTIQHGHFPLNTQSIELATKIIKDLIKEKFDLNKLTSNGEKITSLSN
ncbi:MAG: DEAD/DEAH box helicase [Microgenomates group bacterium]